jgi:hypothetical protein
MNEEEVIKLVLRSQKMAFLLGHIGGVMESEIEIFEAQGIRLSESFKSGVQSFGDGLSELFYELDESNG